LRAVFPPPVKKLGEIEDRLAAAVENERARLLAPIGGGGQVVGGSLCTNVEAPPGSPGGGSRTTSMSATACRSRRRPG
jgi:hypothetical protein